MIGNRARGPRLTLSVTIERLEETEAGPRVVAGGATAPPRRDGGPRSGRIFGVALAELDASLREEFQIEPDVRGLVVLGADVGGANEGVLRAGDVIEAMAFRRREHHRRDRRHRRPRRDRRTRHRRAHQPRRR